MEMENMVNREELEKLGREIVKNRKEIVRIVLSNEAEKRLEKIRQIKEALADEVEDEILYHIQFGRIRRLYSPKDIVDIVETIIMRKIEAKKASNMNAQFSM